MNIRSYGPHLRVINNFTHFPLCNLRIHAHVHVHVVMYVPDVTMNLMYMYMYVVRTSARVPLTQLSKDITSLFPCLPVRYVSYCMSLCFPGFQRHTVISWKPPDLTTAPGTTGNTSLQCIPFQIETTEARLSFQRGNTGVECEVPTRSRGRVAHAPRALQQTHVYGSVLRC